MLAVQLPKRSLLSPSRLFQASIYFPRKRSPQSAVHTRPIDQRAAPCVPARRDTATDPQAPFSMAGFKTHITTSSLLGIGYTGVGAYFGMPLESSIIAGGLCGVGGMMPDIDSDSGVPFRESMGFAAAIVPMFLLSRLQEFGLNYEQTVLLGSALYLFVRFGVGRLLARYTVHRGMFHSIPAALTFTGLVFLLYRSPTLQIRYFTAGGMFLGVLSHLLLDEIYAVEWHRGRWRFKKSFGTALKLWGSSTAGNISVYAKLIIVVLMILGEPMVMERYGQLSPVVLKRENWQRHLVQEDPSYEPAPLASNIQPQNWQTTDADQAPVDRTIYDTARRIWSNFENSADQGAK